jgi:hypothetical protein
MAGVKQGQAEIQGIGTAWGSNSSFCKVLLLSPELTRPGRTDLQ